MHKSSTRAHLVHTAERFGVGVEVVAQACVACGPSLDRDVVFSLPLLCFHHFQTSHHQLLQLRFDIPATYAFHRAASLDVAVDLLCFAKGARGRSLAARHSCIPPMVDLGEHRTSAVGGRVPGKSVARGGGRGASSSRRDGNQSRGGKR